MTTFVALDMNGWGKASNHHAAVSNLLVSNNHDLQGKILTVLELKTEMNMVSVTGMGTVNYPEGTLVATHTYPITNKLVRGLHKVDEKHGDYIIALEDVVEGIIEKTTG